MLTREHQAAFNFAGASSLLCRAVEDGESKSLVQFANAAMSAINCFGLCELYTRQAERAKSLKSHPDKAAYSLRIAQRYNEKGLSAMEFAQGAIKTFAGEIASQPPPPRVPELKERLGLFSQDLRDMVLDYEIKASDVQKINQVLDEAVKAAQSKGESGIVDYLTTQTAELSRLRRRADRGAVDNIPIYKIVAIAIAIGLAVFLVYRCLVKRTGCDTVEDRAIAAGISLAILVAQYC